MVLICFCEKFLTDLVLKNKFVICFCCFLQNHIVSKLLPVSYNTITSFNNINFLLVTND